MQKSPEIILGVMPVKKFEMETMRSPRTRIHIERIKSEMEEGQDPDIPTPLSPPPFLTS